MKKFLLAIASFSALLFPLQKPVLAEEFIVSGNGEGSSNNITIQTTQQTSVEQTNNIDVQNNIDTTSNTGENSASSNTGSDTSIQTGDIYAETTVENSANTSIVDAGCCPLAGDTTLTIEGNGSDSQNIIETTLQFTTSITIEQGASINNTVTTDANTGNNNANNNSGNVSIDTGNIAIEQKIENSFINIAQVSATNYGAGESSGDIIIAIRNNGENSRNSIFPRWFSDFFLAVDNNTSIANMIETNANTGGNNANGNNGDVEIKTGDIDIGIQVENGPINTSIADISCCPPLGGTTPPGDPADPTPPPAPTQPYGGGNSGGGGGGSSNSGSGGSSGETLGSAIGGVLPVTGLNWFLATLANLVMFLFGLYLRRRSGNSPGIQAIFFAA